MQNYFPTYTFLKAKISGIFLQTTGAGLQHEPQRAYRPHNVVAMGSPTHFNLQVLQAQAVCCLGPEQSQRKARGCWVLSPERFIAPTSSSPDAGVSFSRGAYLSPAQVPFSNSKHKLARAEGSETKAGTLPPLYTRLPGVCEPLKCFHTNQVHVSRNK